jgi:hypothetical protein
LDTLEGAVFEGFGKAQKPGIVNYAGLLQRGQGLQKSALKRVALSPKR